MTRPTSDHSQQGDRNMNEPLEREFEFYLRNQENLVKSYEGKLIAIKNEQILGAFDSYLEAAEVIFADYDRGSVLFQEVSQDKESNIVTFHSPHVTVP